MSEPPQEALAEAFDADEVLAGLHRRLRPFALPAACLLAIYLFGVVDDWWPTPDSALYQGLARNLFRGEGYRFNGRFSNDVTPGLPVLIGAVRAVFGEGYRALNVLMTLCGLGSLVVAYLTLARWTNRGAAAAAVLGTFFCYLYFRFSHLILTDAPFALLFWLTAYACVRCLRGGWGWLAAIVPLTALAVAIRAPGALILGPLAGAVVLDRQVPAPPIRRLVVAGAVLLSAAVTIGAFYVVARLLADGTPPYLAGPATGGGLLGRFVHVAEGLWRIPGETAKVLTDRHEPRLLGLLLAVLCGTGLVVAWRRGRRLCAAVCLLNIVPSTFLIGAGCVRARYLMAVWPLLLLAILRGLLWVTELRGPVRDGELPPRPPRPAGADRRPLGPHANLALPHRAVDGAAAGDRPLEARARRGRLRRPPPAGGLRRRRHRYRQARRAVHAAAGRAARGRAGPGGGLPGQARHGVRAPFGRGSGGQDPLACPRPSGYASSRGG